MAIERIARCAVISNLAGWILTFALGTAYFHAPGYSTFGQDFFYYQSLARMSRDVAPSEFYQARTQLLAIEADAAAERLERLSGDLRDRTFMLDDFLRQADPRINGSPLPRAIYPQWASLKEFSANEFSKVSPATFGTIRLLGLDRLSFERGLLIWNVLSLVCLGVAVSLLRRWAELPGPSSVYIALALLFDPVLSSFIYAQFAEITLLLVAGFLYLARRGGAGAFMAGILLGLSVVLKPLAVGLVIYLVWEIFIRGERFYAPRSLAGVFVGLLAAALFWEWRLGSGIFRAWLSSFGDWYKFYDYTLYSLSNRSFTASWMEWTGMAPGSSGLRVATVIHALIVISIYGWFFFIPARRRALDHRSAASMALMGALLLSKFLLFYYQVLLLVPLFLLLKDATSKRARGPILLFLVFFVAFGCYEKSDMLLTARAEPIIYLLLLITLGLAAERGIEQSAERSIEREKMRNSIGV